MAGERMRTSLRTLQKRYAKASRKEKTEILNHFCTMTGYHRKYAITLLNTPVEDEPPRASPRRRRYRYSPEALRVIEAVWRAAGYPWSVRLKALLPLWLPWVRERFGLTPELEAEIDRISARQIDRRLASKKRRLKRRLYGRTKPGALLKHRIPVESRSSEVQEPGHMEIDLVSHSGPSASGEFAYSLNVTDVYLGWCETRAILGRGQEGVVAALEEIRQALPFRMRSIHSDNGSEFINYHLWDYCQSHKIAFRRGRPYKKDDNARVEQKNWTHVRRIWGWDRYDTAAAVEGMNGLYRGALSKMMNWFQPAVKLKERGRVGARVVRRYDAAQTPLDRLVAWYGAKPTPPSVQALLAARKRTNPFELSLVIEKGVDAVSRLQAPRRRRG